MKNIIGVVSTINAKQAFVTTLGFFLLFNFQLSLADISAENDYNNNSISHSQQRQLPQESNNEIIIGNDNNNNNSNKRISRNLGDFDRFNELFDNARIIIEDDFDVSQKVALLTLNLKIQHIECYDMTIGDISMDYVKASSRQINVDVNVRQLDLICDVDYRYEYGVLHGTGTVRVTTDNNSLSTQLQFVSTNWNTSPPRDSNVLGCQTNIEITNMEFFGDFVSNIVEIFERLLRNVIEKAIEDLACDELGSLGTTFVSDMLSIAGDALEDYVGDDVNNNDSIHDPLYLERTAQFPSSLKPLDLQDTSTLIGTWFQQALGQIDTLLGSTVPDPTNVGPGGADLGVNVLLRQNLLDQNRALTVDISQIPGMDPIIFQGHDRLTETTIRLNQIKLLGLDTLTRFNSIQTIGSQTLQTQMTWDHLSFQAEVTVQMRPSTKSDAIIQDSTSRGISETVTINFSVDDVDVLASLFLVIDEDTLGSMQIGPLLFMDNVMGCLLSVLHTTEVSGLRVDPQTVNFPTLTGFVSPGIDRIVTDAVETAFAMYEGVLRLALPNIFQTTLRDFVNTEVLSPFLDTNNDCPILPQPTTPFVDFRDLLLPPNLAQFFGGTGQQPYGDVAHTALSLIEQYLLGTSDDGLLDLNNFLIRPITKASSGISGTMGFSNELIKLVKTNFANDYIRSFVNRFEIGLMGAQIQNLDTLKPPVAILDVTGEPHKISNRLTFGPVQDRPLNVSTTFHLLLQGPNENPLHMDSQVDVSVSFPTASVLLDLLMKIDTESFLQFPLQDILIPECWLATIPAPLMDASGNRLNDASEDTLAISLFGLDFSSLNFDVNFLSTRSMTGFSIISDLLNLLQSTGASSTFLRRTQTFAEEIANSAWTQAQLDQMLFHAPHLCPSRPEYDPDYSRNTQSFELAAFPALSPLTIDTLFYAAGLVAEIGFVTYADQHRGLEPSDPLSSQQGYTFDEAVLDWTNLGETRLGSLMDVIIDALARYLRTTDDDGDLEVNKLIRQYLFDGAEHYQMDFENVSFDLPGVKFEITSLVVKGLDSFTRFDIFEPIAPQTISNTIKMDEVIVEVNINIIHKSRRQNQDFTISFSVGDIDISMAIFLALRQNEVDALNLGSLMNTTNILPCLLSTVESMQITQLQVVPGIFSDPQMDGLIDETSSSLVEFTTQLLAVYRDQIIETIPKIFDHTMRNILNGLAEVYLAENTCAPPQTDFDTMFVDFRRFFDDEDDTYGDLSGILRNLLDSELLSEDSMGRPRINDALIVPYTRGQSGVEGELQFPRDIFGFQIESLPQFGIDMMMIEADNPTMRNLDTIASPIELFSPDATDGNLLHNLVTVGTTTDPFQFAMRGFLQVSGDPALEMTNEMEISIDMVQTEMITSLITKLNAESLFQFPIGDIGNPDCWLSALAGTLIDQDGVIHADGETGLAFESILLSMSSARFNVECLNCTSSGLEILPEVLGRLDSRGISDILERRLLALGLDFVRSDYFQAYMNSLLVNGALRCPHSPLFTDISATSDYPLPALPAMDSDSLETVAFAATIFTHLATIVIAESHSSYDTNSTDPLSGQVQLEQTLDPSIRLVNFTSLDVSLGEWVDVAFGQLIAYLSSSVGNDMRINGLLRSTLLDKDGSITMEFEDLHVGGDNMDVSLKRLRVTDLDTISSVNVFDAIGPQTIRNELTWDRLGVEVVFSMGTSGYDSESGRFLQSGDEITVNVNLANIDVSLAFLLAMDLDMLGSLELGSVLDIKNILPCLLSSAQAASLTELQVAIGSITRFTVEGFQSEELASAAAESGRMMLDEYGSQILSSMPGFFDSTVRAVLNNWIDYNMVDWTNTACPKSSFEAPGPSFIDFRDLLLSVSDSKLLGGSGLTPYGDLFRTAYELVQDLLFKVDPVTGMSVANDALMGPLTRSQSNTTGRVFFPGNLIDGGSRLKVGGLDATVRFRASDFRIDNLDTVGSPMKLLAPIEGDPYPLNNTATFGAGDRPLQFGIKLFLLIGDADDEIRNEVDVTLDLETANILLMAMLKIAESRFFNFPLRDALNYNCWMATIPAPDLDDRGVRMEGSDPTVSVMELVASISRANLNMTCIECSSPRMPELIELLSSSNAQKEVTDLSNEFLDYATTLMGGNYLQLQLDRMLVDAARNCPHRPEYEFEAQKIEYESFDVPPTDYNTTYLALLGGVTLGLVLVVGFVVFCVRCFVRHRHSRWLRTLPAEQVRRLALQQEKEQKQETEISSRTQSMFTSPDVPSFIRWSMPFVLLGNIALFLSGHLSLGATVNIEAELAGQIFQASNFFEFSMAKSTVDIWNAGGRELAILILIFSGIWPYTKTLITLALWFIPPSSVSVSKRGSILLWLDWLAKWSMIDIFVLVISIAAFRISVSSPNTGFLPPEFYSVNLLVVPLWGLYANMIAQLVSQVSSHFIIHYHRRIVSVARQSQENERKILAADRNTDYVTLDDNHSESETSTSNPEKSKLCEQQFVRPHRGETDKLMVFPWVNMALCALVFCLIILMVLGSVLPSFSLDILGMVGVAVESGQGFEDAKTYHSVFTVIKLLLEEAAFLGSAGDYIGFGTLSALFVVTIMVAPVAQALVLVWQWFANTTPQSKEKISILAEILQAWQYAEVYLIAIFVATWQLGPMSEFMINSYCGSLRDTFAQLVYYGILDEEDAQCFSVKSSIEGGFYILAAGAVLLALVNTFVTKAVFQYFRDQNNSSIDNDDNNDEFVDVETEEEKDGNDDDVDDDDDAMHSKIHPTPVLFTDTFRWLFRRADSTQPRPHATLSYLLRLDEVDENGQAMPIDIANSNNSSPSSRRNNENVMDEISVEEFDDKEQSSDFSTVDFSDGGSRSDPTEGGYSK